MYRLFLFGLLLLNCNLLSVQECQDRIDRTGKSQAPSIASRPSNHHSDNQSLSIIDGASAGTRPCALINSEPILAWKIGGYETLRCYGNYGLQRESGKGNRATIRMLGETAKPHWL